MSCDDCRVVTETERSLSAAKRIRFASGYSQKLEFMLGCL